MTSRDIEILRLINRFGRLNVDQISGYFRISQIRAYQILYRLKSSGYIEHHRVFYNEPGVYVCTTEGARFTEYEKLRELHVASLKHDLAVFDAFLKLKNRMKITSFQTEREIRQNKNLEHFPDIILEAENAKISVEVELSRKSKLRMESIRNFYLKNLEINRIMYFVPEDLRLFIEECFSGFDLFEIYEL